MIYYGGNDYRDYLSHHGIVGMKWGHKNGPPYPLDAADHSASEKKAGWRKSLNSHSAGRVVKKAAKTVAKATAKGAKKFVDYNVRTTKNEIEQYKAYRKQRRETINANRAAKKQAKAERREKADAEKKAAILALNDPNQVLKKKNKRLFTAEEYAKAEKESIVRSKDTKWILKHQSMFTNQEINDILLREQRTIQLESLKKEEHIKSIERGKRALESLAGMAKSTMETVDKAYQLKQNIDKYSKADKESKLDKVLRSGDKKQIEKHMTEFSNQQINDLKKREENVDAIRNRWEKNAEKANSEGKNGKKDKKNTQKDQQQNQNQNQNQNQKQNQKQNQNQNGGGNTSGNTVASTPTPAVNNYMNLYFSTHREYSKSTKPANDKNTNNYVVGNWHKTVDWAKKYNIEKKEPEPKKSWRHERRLSD